MSFLLSFSLLAVCHRSCFPCFSFVRSFLSFLLSCLFSFLRFLHICFFLRLSFFPLSFLLSFLFPSLSPCFLLFVSNDQPIWPSIFCLPTIIKTWLSNYPSGCLHIYHHQALYLFTDHPAPSVVRDRSLFAPNKASRAG